MLRLHHSQNQTSIQIILDDKTTIVVVGGKRNKKSIETIGDNKCDTAPDLPSVVYDYPAVFNHSDKLLVCGGRGNSKSCLWLDGRVWRHHSNLTHMRGLASSISMSTGTYIFGGYYEGGRNTIDFLPVGSSNWKTLPGPTKTPHLGFFHTGCVVKKSEMEVLLIGGYGTGKRILGFDISKEKWTTYYQELIEYRYGHECVTFHNEVIIIGGNGVPLRNFTEVIDLISMESRIIQTKSPITSPADKQGLAITDVSGKPTLLLFGGDKHGNKNREIHAWKPDEEKWVKTELKLNEVKYGFGYGVIPRSLLCPNE